MARKIRLDKLVLQVMPDCTMDMSQALIASGKVRINGLVCDKAGSQYPEDSHVEVKQGKQFVSRGGEKLAAALTSFHLLPEGNVCADIGCSTGGFTDCLLQNGAAKVYSVDVGYGILDWKLRQDKRVVVLERTNARFLTVKEIPEPLDLAVIDASFISLELLLPPLTNLFAKHRNIVALIKPQFQLPKDKVGKGGIVRDNNLHDEAIEMVISFGRNLGLQNAGVIDSPIVGAKGNKEFLIYFTDK